LPIERLRELSRVQPFAGPLHVLLEWALILGAAWACAHHFSVPAYVLCVIWIGARQHALAILLHEATHGRLFPSRRWNDALSDAFLARPLFASTRAYRKVHMAHHRHLRTEADPDFVAQRAEHEYQLPKTWASFAGLFARDILGLGIVRQIK